MGIYVNNEKCTGCTICVRTCGVSAIEMKDKKAVIDQAKCTYCGACVDACKFKAITVEVERKAAVSDIDEYKGVWIFAETTKGGEASEVSLELLGEGRKLADSLGEELCAIVIGHSLTNAIETLSRHGADKIYVIDSPELASFNDEPYANALTYAIRQFKPSIVLSGATSIGRSFIARVAVMLKTGLTADCTKLEIDPENKILLQTRPAFGGNLMATIKCENVRPQMATVRPKVFRKAEENMSKTAEIINIEPSAIDLSSKTKVIGTIPEEKEEINIAEFDIVISGGRGMQNEKGFLLIKELAEAVGGVVGASRGAVDSGWISHPHQVGQTGKVVTPKLYVAIGISGAVQHIAGMETAETIVAINKDPNAPIFDVATYGIVGDAFEIIPELIRKVKAR